MKALTEKGNEKVRDLALRYGLKFDTVASLLDAVLRGNGTMAQFNLSELGGQGQWMRGGMTMVGDMFNHSLKNKVNSLCEELSHLLGMKDIFVEDDLSMKGELMGTGTWWPSEYGNPTASGSQNNMRYAYFAPPVQRLVLERGSKKSIYDTLSHRIGGIAQQQGNSDTVLFTSQLGIVDIESLPIISEPEPTGYEPTKVSPTIAPAPEREDIFTTIEKLGAMVQKGLLSEEEFATKKAELLKRL